MNFVVTTNLEIVSYVSGASLYLLLLHAFQNFLMRCLKPKVDTGKVLKEKPAHVPPNCGNFKLSFFSLAIGSNL